MRISNAVFRTVVGAAMLAFTGTMPAQAWQVAQGERGFAVIHQDDDIRFALACSPDRPGGLLVRVTGDTVSNAETIVLIITQSNGRTSQFSAIPRDEAEELTGIMRTSADFLNDFSAGTKFQLVINGTLFMDTNMTGTANARSAIRTACGV